jgi:hypothetical protein
MKYERPEAERVQLVAQMVTKISGLVHDCPPTHLCRDPQ